MLEIRKKAEIEKEQMELKTEREAEDVERRKEELNELRIRQ